MSIFLVKSVLSIVLILFTMISVFTMFEIFGRKSSRFSTAVMKKIHTITGIFYFVIFAIVTYYCLSFIVLTKAELSTRSTLHGIFAFLIFILFGLKLSYTRIYRQFYDHVKIIGLLMALLTFSMVGTSAGYYLLVSEMGTDVSFDTIAQYKKQLALAKDKHVEVNSRIIVQSDPESIMRGNVLFDARCKYCHNTHSTETVVGPGLKGVLNNKKLPVSKRPATPENIIEQLRQPFSRMPSFEYLTEEEVADILAYLNTL